MTKPQTGSENPERGDHRSPPQRTGGPKGSGLTPELLRAHLAAGWSQKRIADQYGVSKQSVNYQISYWGLPKTPRQHARTQYPWRVVPPQQDSWLDKRLRDHAEYQATGGQGMDEVKLRRLHDFYNQLERENAVVEYHPDIPPSRTVKHGGYRLVPRTKSDGRLIIRVGEGVLSRAQRDIWTFPTVRP